MKHQSIIWRIGLLGVFLSVFAGLSFYFQAELISFFIWLYSFLETSIAQHHRAYACGYVFVYVLDSLFALPLASILTLLAGHFFGVGFGLLLTLVGMLAGALLSFFAVRYFVGGYFQKVYAEKLQRFNYFFERYGTLFFLLIRLVPVVPFSLVNILAAFTRVSWRVFALLTLLGMIPLLVFLVLLGAYSEQILALNLHLLLIWFSLVGGVGFLLIFFLKKYRPML